MNFTIHHGRIPLFEGERQGIRLHDDMASFPCLDRDCKIHDKHDR